jgi:DNA-binding transcriptional MerR regulator
MSEILAFTADNVCRLTGLSGRQLRYWDATDFFSPELLDEYKQRAFGRIYSFRDVVGLRTIAVLRNLHRIPLQELRRVGEWLQVHHESPWSTLRFALSGRKVVFADPGTQHYLEATGGGQSVMQIALEPIASEMRQAAQQLRERSTEQFGSVLRKRYVVQNAWVLAGTRIPTQAVWNFHQAGFSPEALIHEYPRLTPVDVKAAIEFEASRKRAV